MIEDAPTECWMMKRCNLFGRVGMVIFWYWDGSDDPEDPITALRGIEMLPDLLRGDTESFSRDDWFTFWDALGSYPHRDDEMAELYVIADQGFKGILPSGGTKQFLDIDEDQGIVDADEEE